MSDKSVILSVGDSFATFDTHDCANLEIIHGDCHAVQLVAKNYNVDALNGGAAGGGNQDNIVKTLYNIHNVPNIKLIFFYISQVSRVPVASNPQFETKVDGLENFHNIEDLGPPSQYSNILDGLNCDSADVKNYISLMPLFKFYMDDLAYVSLLVQVCKQHDISIIFVSEFVDSATYKDLLMFSSEDHVRICDSYMCRGFDLDRTEHQYSHYKGNHLCQHYQEHLANEYVVRYREFIEESIL